MSTSQQTRTSLQDSAGTPPEFIEFIEDNAGSFIQRLKHAVGIRSVSVQAEHRPDVFDMGIWLDGELQKLGVTTTRIDLGEQKDTGGDAPLQLPYVILGKIGNDPKKKTVLVYGHYDVQPADKDDGWATDPWVLDINEQTGRLTGRGATDDKGPVLGWLNVLEAHKSLGLELPVNMRFCFEGMEESGSEGLDDFIAKEAKKDDGFFEGVSCVCISDNYWLNTRTPCLTYGLRGIVTFQMTVSGATQDLHSGMFGRVVHEPMTDLAILMSSLVAPGGKILVKDVENMVPPPDVAERNFYDAMNYTVEDLDESTGAHVGLSDDKAELLMGRMRYPSLSLHGIEGAYSGPGVKTVIPHAVTAKFSIRTVKQQTSAKVAEAVQAYVEKKFAQIGTRNKLVFKTLDQADAWDEDNTHWNYQAAKRATKTIWGRDPDLTREGGSIPVAITFSNNLCVNVLLLPMGRGDDGAHSTNEKIDRDNFIKGSMLLGTYLYEISATTKDQ